MKNEEKILSGEAAGIATVSQVTIKNWAERGILPFERVGSLRVFKRKDVQDLVAKRRGR